MSTTVFIIGMILALILGSVVAIICYQEHWPLYVNVLGGLAAGGFGMFLAKHVFGDRI